MTRIINHINCLLLVFMAAVILSAELQAARPDRSPGTYIPILKNTHAGEFVATRWVSNAGGGYLEVNTSPARAWEVLDQALDSLGIKPLERNAATREWLTDWVVWKYDKKKATGRSKPGFSFGSQNLERHRFLFTVIPGASDDSAKIVAADTLRQREVDIAPDSEYSWLEWKERNNQQGAADTFLQRLQLPIESALATEFVVTEEITRTTEGDLVVTETDVDTSADVVLITIPGAEVAAVPPRPPARDQTEPVVQKSASSSAPGGEAERESVSVEAMVIEIPPPVTPEPEPVGAAVTAGKSIPEQPPVPEPQPSEKVLPIPELAESSMAESPQITREPQEAVSTQPQTLQPPQPPEQSVVKEPASAPVVPAVATAPPQADTAAPTKSAIKADTEVTPAANGLLVRAPPAVAWPALLQALDDLEIPIDREDGQQHLLTTGWVSANYDAKNHQLLLRSKEGPKWAFSFLGKGNERQLFQIVMVSANQGKQSIIYAYNTGFQQQIDRTPDSSQTLLAWEGRDTSPDVALALLRRLRIVIPH